MYVRNLKFVNGKWVKFINPDSFSNFNTTIIKGYLIIQKKNCSRIQNHLRLLNCLEREVCGIEIRLRNSNPSTQQNQ